MSGKTQGEWEAKTLAEFEMDKAVWKAQKLKDPEGKPFLSVRKFVKRSSGELQITRVGITFENDAVEEIEQVAALMKRLLKRAKKNAEAA